jgi:hypothetical protein
MFCENAAANNELDAAFEVAGAVLEHRTTDSAYADLSTWLLWQQQALARRTVRQRAAITHPRIAGPAGRTNANPYLPPA